MGSLEDPFFDDPSYIKGFVNYLNKKYIGRIYIMTSGRVRLQTELFIYKNMVSFIYIHSSMFLIEYITFIGHSFPQCRSGIGVAGEVYDYDICATTQGSQFAV